MSDKIGGHGRKMMSQADALAERFKQANNSPVKQTPEQLAAIRERHKNADETQHMMRPPGGLLGAGDYAHKDRAALLSHVEALEGEVKRLRRNDELQMNRAIAAERKLARVRELPRYGTQEIKDEYGDDPSVMWIAEYELEAALDESGERK